MHTIFKKLTSLVLALLMVITMVPVFTLTARAAVILEATFEFGENGDASHNESSTAMKDGTEYTNNNYTLTIKSPSNVYGDSRDAKGNSALKLGTSKAVGSFSFTVPENISKVVINVAGYKTKTVGINVNGTTATISTLSDNGEYTPIEVDTSSQKTVTFATTTNKRAMIDSIMFYGDSSSSSTCEHTNTKTVAEVPATCTTPGTTAGVKCSDCGVIISGCKEISVIDHIYENGACTMCGKSEPVLPFKIGDTVIFTGSKADGTGTRELTGFADGEKYGTATEYSDTVACTFPIEVVAGYESGTYAFKNGDSYITCNGEKNVNLSATLDAKSSWKVDLDNNKLVIKSCSNDTYCLQYNPGTPRFTTYTSAQQPIKVLVIPVEKWNITLKDDLSVNFYLNLKVNDKVNFIFNEKTVTCDASELTLQADGTYLATVRMAAAQMTDTITIQVEGSSVKKTYSIRQYADAILGSEKYSDATKALVNEMLNYGGMAQAFFGYNTENLANKGITGAGAAPVPENAASDMDKENDSDGCITYYGASLVYRDKIAVRFYFDAVEGQNLIFQAAGKVCKPVLTGGRYMIEVPDICPQDYGTPITVTVTNADGHKATVSYGPMNYIVRMYHKEGATTEMQNLMQALYNYHLAAVEYKAQNP